jgi:hypothetical protein
LFLKNNFRREKELQNAMKKKGTAVAAAAPEKKKVQPARSASATTVATNSAAAMPSTKRRKIEESEEESSEKHTTTKKGSKVDLQSAESGEDVEEVHDDPEEDGDGNAEPGDEEEDEDDSGDGDGDGRSKRRSRAKRSLSQSRLDFSKHRVEPSKSTRPRRSAATRASAHLKQLAQDVEDSPSQNGAAGDYVVDLAADGSDDEEVEDVGDDDENSGDYSVVRYL